MSEIEEERASFSGKLGFILATSASAVGLGNLWRFPYETSHYGGGIFVLIYVILAFSFGISLMLLETSFGRKTGKSCIAAFSGFAKKYRFIGILAAIIPMLIVPYYCLIGGWVTKWFYETSLGNLDMLSESGGAYWWDFITGETSSGFTGPSIWFLIFAGLCILCILIGVEKGIEKLSKILMPTLLVMIVAILCYEMTIDGIWDGVVFYLNPDISALSPDTFLGAISQIFYSMSIAMGILITYGSYTKKDVDLEKSAITVGMIDTGVALLAGFIIIPVAFMFGFGDSSGMGLMFVALPQVFEMMPGGAIVAPIFYLLVMFAALTSAVSLAETCASVFVDGEKMDRMRAVGFTAVIIIIVGMICALGFPGGPLDFDTPLSQGAGWLGFLDTITNSIMMPIAAILLCIFVGFVVKTTFLEEEIELSSKFRLKPLFRVMVMYIAPIFLTAILIVGLLGIAGIQLW
ncbi:MAG: sodium-dependent transporter [Candidatus Methanomethylophilaceae archaeon]|nr:sodium-dependent transporter [Candidatus Methanomethylophilaceae archaeon]